MEETARKEQHNSTLHVFLLGIVTGVAITLLFTTKKGRRLLRLVTDEGMGKIGDWEEALTKTRTEMKEDAGAVSQQTESPSAASEIDDLMTGEDYDAASEMKEEPAPPHVSPHAVKHSLKVEHKEEERLAGTRRFFRNVKR